MIRQIGNATLYRGLCLEFLRDLAEASVDAIVCDPPYGLSFMGKRWDYDVPSVDVWSECLRVLKPGGHLLAFAGTRTQHRMAVRIEDAGFEIRDMIAWVYGSGFPKSLDVSKAIDKMDASEEQKRRRLKFTAWVRSTGITAKQIDEATGTNMGGHYTTAASQPAIMTREHLEACRHLLGNVPEWVESEADIRSVESRNMAERQVLDYKRMTDTSIARPAISYAAQGVKQVPQRHVAMTAPLTDAARQWQGWGTALKPSLEPVTVARKPLAGNVAENVLRYGTGGLNIDGCRVGTDEVLGRFNNARTSGTSYVVQREAGLVDNSGGLGRWPANLIHDGSEEVLAGFPVTSSAVRKPSGGKIYGRNALNESRTEDTTIRGFSDTGSAARFFYCAKASKRDRDEGCEGLEAIHRANGNKWTDQDYRVTSGERPPSAESGPRRNHHPTVKPTDLMRYLCRLVTPPGGVVFDPFMGSGSTGKAAALEGFRFIGCERESEYFDIACRRIELAYAQGKLFQEPAPKGEQVPMWG